MGLRRLTPQGAPSGRYAERAQPRRAQALLAASRTRTSRRPRTRCARPTARREQDHGRARDTKARHAGSRASPANVTPHKLRHTVVGRNPQRLSSATPQRRDRPARRERARGSGAATPPHNSRFARRRSASRRRLADGRPGDGRHPEGGGDTPCRDTDRISTANDRGEFLIWDMSVRSHCIWVPRPISSQRGLPADQPRDEADLRRRHEERDATRSAPVPAVARQTRAPADARRTRRW